MKSVCQYIGFFLAERGKSHSYSLFMESDSTQLFPCQALLGRQITAFTGNYIPLFSNFFSLDTPGDLFYSSRRKRGILITGHWSALYPSSTRAPLISTPSGTWKRCGTLRKPAPIWLLNIFQLVNDIFLDSIQG